MRLKSAREILDSNIWKKDRIVTRYVNCKMHVVHDYPGEDEATFDIGCEVEFDNENGIAISFYEKGQPKKWVGLDDLDGHFNVHDSAIETHRGTLHMSSDSDILEGRWHDISSGFWEIKLGELSPIEE